MNAMRMNKYYLSKGSHNILLDEESNIDVVRFFELLKDSNESLWDECTTHSKLSVIARVLTIKWDYKLSKASYDNIIQWVKSMLPKRNRLKKNLDAAKSMIKPLGLWYQKIDIFPKFYILYYGEYTNFIECKTCQHALYKPNSSTGRTFIAYKKKLWNFPITYWLQMLFMSLKIIEHIT